VRGAHQPHRDGIVQNARLLHQLVRGAANGYAKGGSAGLACLHEFECRRQPPEPGPRTIIPMSWIGWALLSAAFAAATALLAKVGVAHVDSNLAMALRTTVVLVFAWSIALALGKHGELRSLDRRTVLFLVLSGLATGLSWLCYFRALQLGPASRVAPLDKLSVPLVMVFAWLLLGEKLTAPVVVGGLLITAGAVVMVLG
jgi:transporter family protein